MMIKFYYLCKVDVFRLTNKCILRVPAKAGALFFEQMSF